MVNSTPISSPGTMFRTTASAKTMPPGTSKTRVRSAPTRSVMDPQRDRPPMLNVLTRETCCWPPPFQVTDMPFGSAIRWWRRVSQRISVAIRHGKGTSSIGREPIVQTFLSGSTLESQSVLQHSRSAQPLERPEGIESESLSLQDAGPVRIVIKGGRPRALEPARHAYPPAAKADRGVKLYRGQPFRSEVVQSQKWGQRDALRIRGFR